MANPLDNLYSGSDKDSQVGWALDRALKHLKNAEIAREGLKLEKWKHERTETRLNARVRELNARVTELESELAQLRPAAQRRCAVTMFYNGDNTDDRDNKCRCDDYSQRGEDYADLTREELEGC